ncbi:Crp/Fnr family transcriptional regulator [Dyadobacter tibetensis]|uniref:Crp/Fnr family transcriptional regulator n=1 Tax=Dyadobacter tibetensis TaxID=1211851 RepID=UPI00046F2A44|nr:Crp/Fnr family transcriptional regulator [Dyadobacter tibetensis]
MELITYARQQIVLSPEMEEEIDRAFKSESFCKNHKILQPDNFSKKVFFIEKGFARTYYYKNGKEITHHFLSENNFYLTIDSIFYNRPSLYGLDAIEDCTMRTIPYPELEKYLDQSKALEKLGRLALVNSVKMFSDKLYSIQFQSAPDRYLSMIQSFPDILLRAPLGQIASYLGITQETLSRIRAARP